jgi:hypothetical protein
MEGVGVVGELGYLGPEMGDICVGKTGEVDPGGEVFDLRRPGKGEKVLEMEEATGSAMRHIKYPYGFGVERPVPNYFHRPIIIYPVSKNVRKYSLKKSTMSKNIMKKVDGQITTIHQALLSQDLEDEIKFHAILGGIGAGEMTLTAWDSGKLLSFVAQDNFCREVVIHTPELMCKFSEYLNIAKGIGKLADAGIFGAGFLMVTYAIYQGLRAYGEYLELDKWLVEHRFK